MIDSTAIQCRHMKCWSLSSVVRYKDDFQRWIKTVHFKETAASPLIPKLEPDFYEQDMLPFS
jgi:hypothetical protein